MNTSKNIEYSHGPQTGRKVPAEIQTLDDNVLAYSSDPREDRKPKAVSPLTDGCCQTTFNPDEIDTSKYFEVIFKGERRAYCVNTLGVQIEPQQFVVVEAERGVDLGVIGSIGDDAYHKTRLRLRPCEEEPKRLVRFAEDADMKILHYHREQEMTAFEVCCEKIHKLGLVMKLVDVEFQFDRNRVTFYFTADGRVDFRELVRELAAEYRTRIELRQIGPRDEAKRMGGFGVCGRQLCCNAWLTNFEPISTEMAKLQNLALNPSKLSGQCGRLKCCLAYELQVYEALLKNFPPVDLTFKTEKGIARIEKIDLFHEAIYIRYEHPEVWERMTLEKVMGYVKQTVS